jgi:GDP-4-dehydro-6-deoxy-D-mannose reductase
MNTKKTLITGIHGFAGKHLCIHLLKNNYEVTGLSRGITPEEKKIWSDESLDGIPVMTSDLSDSSRIASLDNFSKYQYVYHLAGTAFVPEGWKDPAGVLQSNTMNTLNLLNALKEGVFRGRFIYISSSDVYGNNMEDPGGFSEDACCHPESPYAASKFSSELFAKYYTNSGFEIIVARPFNHIGPGQKKEFVVPAFLYRILEAKMNNSGYIEVGDIESKRDFTDVRDVAGAYRCIGENGISGEIYNVCSGKAISIKEILDLSLRITGTELNFKVNKDLLRPEGSSIRYGNATKLKSLGWKQNFSLEDSIRDMYQYIVNH